MLEQSNFFDHYEYWSWAPDKLREKYPFSDADLLAQLETEPTLEGCYGGGLKSALSYDKRGRKAYTFSWPGRLVHFPLVSNPSQQRTLTFLMPLPEGPFGLSLANQRQLAWRISLFPRQDMIYRRVLAFGKETRLQNRALQRPCQIRNSFDQTA